MFALIGPLIGAVSSLFGAGTSVMSAVTGSFIGHIPMAAWIGFGAGVFACDGHVRDATLHLLKVIVGSVI